MNRKNLQFGKRLHQIERSDSSPNQTIENEFSTQLGKNRISSLKTLLALSPSDVLSLRNRWAEKNDEIPHFNMTSQSLSKDETHHITPEVTSDEKRSDRCIRRYTQECDLLIRKVRSKKV